MDNDKNPFSEEEIIEDNEQIENQSEDLEENSENAIQSDDKVQKDDKFEELNNKYIRLAADFDNFRKRTLQEKEELSKYTTAEILKKLAASLDTFDRAKESLKNIEDAKTIKEGYEVAYKQLLDTLAKIGLVEIEALGVEFNPEKHEAITQIESEEYEPNVVGMVAQKGYMFKDKVVRPALVGVVKNKENE